MPSTHLKTALAIAALFAGAIICLPLSCAIGQYPATPPQIFAALRQFLGFGIGPVDPELIVIAADIRLARGVSALLCGGSLALAGAILQGVLRNPLADPYILGISAGAACGASIAIACADFFTAFAPLPHNVFITAAAMSGALLSLCLSLLLSRGGRDSGNIILAGIAVAAFLGAITALVKALNEESVTSIVFWMLGSLQGAGWQSLPMLAAAFVPGALAAAWGWRKLDILSLGDSPAASLGLRAPIARLWLLLGASMMAAGCVAVAGIIGFVGLVAPHILRMLLGGAHGPLLLASIPAGGLLLLLADCAARAVLGNGQELPAGVITSIAGAPFFAFLIWRCHP